MHVNSKSTISGMNQEFFCLLCRGANNTFQCYILSLLVKILEVQGTPPPRPQTSFFNKIFIKNGFYGTNHIFKKYFVTVFSIFNFQQNIKRYPNGPMFNKALTACFFIYHFLKLSFTSSCFYVQKKS